MHAGNSHTHAALGSRTGGNVVERVVADARIRLFSYQSSQGGLPAATCRIPDIHQQEEAGTADIAVRKCRQSWRGNLVRAPLLSAVSLIVVIAGLSAAASCANATWKPEYANAPQEVQDWYRSAQLTEPAQKRFGFKSCCAHSDVVKTEFRVDKKSGNDEWYWMKDGDWTLIPGDVIHWGESAPDQQPTLFAIGNLPTCFYPGEGGL